VTKSRCESAGSFVFRPGCRRKIPDRVPTGVAQLKGTFDHVTLSLSKGA